MYSTLSERAAQTIGNFLPPARSLDYAQRDTQQAFLRRAKEYTGFDRLRGITEMAAVQIGDNAPDFEMPAHDGTLFRLSDHRGKVVVLFFYPRNGTPLCTQEACAFRDHYEDFVAAGAVVVGVSSGGVEEHQAFASRHRLPFVLLADRNGELRRLFGVPKTWGIFPGRTTYVIDQQGTVRHIFSGQLAVDRHVGEALAVVRSLSADSSDSDTV